MGLTIILLAGMFIWVVVKLIKIQIETYTKIEDTRPPEYELLKEIGIINTNRSNGGIVVPDDVHIKNSTQKSTQNVDCRKYTTPRSFERNVEKIVVENGYKSTKSTTYTYQTSKTNDVTEEYEEPIYDDNNDDPIQEKQSFFSKLFGPKIDRL